jgi:hypothetical protein
MTPSDGNRIDAAPSPVSRGGSNTYVLSDAMGCGEKVRLARQAPRGTTCATMLTLPCQVIDSA